jgi:hypothetical protein
VRVLGLKAKDVRGNDLADDDDLADDARYVGFAPIKRSRSITRTCERSRPSLPRVARLSRAGLPATAPDISVAWRLQSSGREF